MNSSTAMFGGMKEEMPTDMSSMHGDSKNPWRPILRHWREIYSTSGIVQIEEIRPVDQTNHSGQDDAFELETAGRYKTGSIWIDPETHQIIQLGPGKEITKSSDLYAVGAMTRGQIIDASMARGIVKATSRIADDLVHYLTRIYRGEIAETK